MEQPKQYDIVNPLWQRGRAYGHAEMLEKLYEQVKADYIEVGELRKAGDGSDEWVEGFVTAMMIALDAISEVIEETE